MAQFDLKDAVIKIKDGTAVTPLEMTVIVGEGNMTYSEKVNREYIKDRGILYGVRDGDEEPVELSLDFMWEFIKASTGDPPTVEDALKKTGVAATWVTSGADACEPYCVDIEVTYTPNCAGVETETLSFTEFRYESLEHDLRAGTISISGKCNIKTVTSVRA